MEERNKINNAYIYLRFNGGEYKEQMYKQLMNDFISSKYKNQNIKIKYFIDYNGRANCINKELKKFLALLNDNENSIFLTKKVTMLSRSVFILYDILDLLQKNNTDIYCLDENAFLYKEMSIPIYTSLSIPEEDNKEQKLNDLENDEEDLELDNEL